MMKRIEIDELRGFERFCEGRRAEDLPIITTRICGVCPVAHHFASAKALDVAFNTEPTETAKKLRELMYCGYFIYDHILHFYFLGGPDFVVGPDAPPAERNILGVSDKQGRFGHRQRSNQTPSLWTKDNRHYRRKTYASSMRSTWRSLKGDL